MSAVPTDPRVSFQPRHSHLPALGSASSVDGKTAGVTNRVSETEGLQEPSLRQSFIAKSVSNFPNSSLTRAWPSKGAQVEASRPSSVGHSGTVVLCGRPCSCRRLTVLSLFLKLTGAGSRPWLPRQGPELLPTRV